jgi:hypothetical protein
VVGHTKEGSGEGGIAIEIKNAEMVMEEQVIESSSLALFSTKPNILTGPQSEAH